MGAACEGDVVTTDRDFKRMVRERMAKTGESYVVARAQLRRPMADDGSRVIEKVAQHFGCSVEDLTGPSRRSRLVWARQLVMYLLAVDGELSVQAVGQSLGGRPAHVVRHAIDKVGSLRRQPVVASQLAALSAESSGDRGK